ncbi:MAG: phage major capsid protein [Succinimonas sp.]|nr:phage major capsid protein [Succinimonas sp.]
MAIKVTEELLYDAAFNLEGYIIDQFGKAMANAEEDAFLNGTGRGQPLGLFAETGGGTPALSAASINADHIMQLIYALKRPYRKSARFIMHDKVIAAIRQLKDNNGMYLWQPALTSGKPKRQKRPVSMAERLRASPPVILWKRSSARRIRTQWPSWFSWLKPRWPNY